MNHGLHYYQWQMYFVLKPCCMSGCNLYIHCMYLKQLKKYYLVTRQPCEIYHKLFTNIIVSMTRFCCCTPESYECLSRVLLDQICKKKDLTLLLNRKCSGTTPQGKCVEGYLERNSISSSRTLQYF